MPTPPSRTDLRALLIEDSELDAGLLLRELNQTGFDVISRRVQTAVELRAALATEPWDIVLSDFKLPKFNGMEALAIVQASGLDVPFILISGAVGEETAVAAMRAGASDYFVKGRLATLGPAINRELREVIDRRARRTADEQVRKLNHAVQQAPVSLMITDLAGRIEYVNPQFTRNTGYTLAEVREQNPRVLKSGLMPPEFYQDLWQTITAGQNWQGEIQNRTKDGRLVWELVSISPICDASGQATHYLGAKLDITHLKSSNEKIREQAALLEIATDAIYVRRSDGVITFWNSGAEALYGWSRAEALGRKITELNLQELSAEAEDAGQLLARGLWSGERWQAKRDGTAIVILSRLTVVPDDRGRPAYVFAINTDITASKKLEEKFLRAQRLESIGMLASGIAHDLNNVLAPIGMVSTLLRANITAPGDLRLLDTLEKCAHRGAGLVKQILGFAHGIGGEAREVQVKHLLHDIVQVITETFPKSILLVHRVPNDLWPVNANPTQIHQVLLNLCVNARDAMPEGGTLTLRAENCGLDAAAAHAIPDARPGAWLRVYVQDTGTGIAPDVLERIWEPFFTTKAPDEGTGLGLSTVRGIVATCRGFISLQTAVGRGSTFAIYLPAVESALPGASAGAAPAAGRGHGELILLVDDEAMIRDAARGVLVDAGYQVVTAANGAEAATVFASRAAEFSLVLTDVDMPNLNGHGLARAVRLFKPELKILAMSGLARRRTDAEALERFDDFILKPFGSETLLHTVERVLHGEPIPPPHA